MVVAVTHLYVPEMYFVGGLHTRLTVVAPKVLIMKEKSKLVVLFLAPRVLLTH